MSAIRCRATALAERSKPTEKTARNVGDDRDPAVARFVQHDAGMAIDACDALTVRRVVRIEGERHAAHVEREPRRQGLDQLIDALPLECGDAKRCGI